MKLKNLIAGVCALGGFAVFAQVETVEYWDPVGKVTRLTGLGRMRSPTRRPSCR